MGFTVSAGGGGSFEIVPEGVYIGRCYRLIDLGTQTSTGQFGTKSQKKVMISWELLDDEVKMADGRPYSVHKRYTASLHEKADLRKDLEAWRGQKFTEAELDAFDLKNVLGTYCAIQVLHSTDGQYANVNTIMKTKERPAPVNEDVSYDLDNPDIQAFEKLSDKLKDAITGSPEWQGLDRQQAIEDGAIEPPEMPEDFLKVTPKKATKEPSWIIPEFPKSDINLPHPNQRKLIKKWLGHLEESAPGVSETFVADLIGKPTVSTRDEADEVISELAIALNDLEQA